MINRAVFFLECGGLNKLFRRNGGMMIDTFCNMLALDGEVGEPIDLGAVEGGLHMTKGITGDASSGFVLLLCRACGVGKSIDKLPSMWYLTDKKSIRSQHGDNDLKLYCDGRFVKGREGRQFKKGVRGDCCEITF